MFVGREKELRLLEGEHRRSGFSLAVVTGRRRIGKTALVRRFAEGRPALYFEAARATMSVNLRRLARAFSRFAAEAGVPFPALGEKNALEDALAFFEALWPQVVRYFEERGQKFILVIDEFPRLTSVGGVWTEEDRRRYVSFDSVLQYMLDEGLQDRSHMVILLGSSASLMKRLFAGDSPLYGRASTFVFLKGLSVIEAAELLGLDLSDPSDRKRLIEAWTIFNGVPHYLVLLRQALEEKQDDLTAAVRRLLFESNVLSLEVQSLFQDEPVSAEILSSIVYALGTSERTQNEIAGLAGVKNPAVYLKVLRESGIAEPVPELRTPTRRRAKRERWRLVDPFLRLITTLGDELFWNGGEEYGLRLWEKRIAPGIRREQGRNFEILWQRTMFDILKSLGTACGRFELFDREGRTKHEYDLVAFYSGFPLLVAETKLSLSRGRLSEFKEKLEVLIERFETPVKPLVLLAGARLDSTWRETFADVPARFFVADLPTPDVLARIAEAVEENMERLKEIVARRKQAITREPPSLGPCPG